MSDPLEEAKQHHKILMNCLPDGSYTKQLGWLIAKVESLTKAGFPLWGRQWTLAAPKIAPGNFLNFKTVGGFMRQREIEEATFNELTKLTTPLSGETLDSVIMRLVKAYRKNGHVSAATPPASGKFITRKTNPDRLRNLMKQKYNQMTYWEAARAVIIGAKQNRMGLLSITNSVFDFPNTPQKSDRVNRAVRSMQVALRGYTGGAASKIFKEPEVDVFELKKK